MLEPMLIDRIEHQAGKLRKRLLDKGVSEPDAKAAAEKYAAARKAVEELLCSAMGAADELARLPMPDRKTMQNLAKGWYRITREEELAKWPDELARLATRYIAEGLDEQSVRAALAAAWKHLAPALPESEFLRMMELVGKVQALARPPAAPRKADGFRAVTEPTPLDAFSESNAFEQLRMALARQDPVVRRCVALRLLRHTSFQRLADELDLTLDDVKLILEKMRPWVKRFTLYFDRDYLWTETARKFTLPDAT